jgi:4'-phosphopantetheinyl transferase
MIDVLYAPLGAPLPAPTWRRYLAQMPSPIRERIERYRRWADRQAGLLGKLLLVEGLRRCGRPAELERLAWDAAGRPFLPGGTDLNISHSGAYVVCALAHGGRVGIDIEQVRPIPLSDFRTQMTPAQWAKIAAPDGGLYPFFRLWTQKEAVVKADGRGLAVPLTRIVPNGGRAWLDGTVWAVREVGIAEGYVCHLAASGADPRVRVEEIRLPRTAA